MSSFLILIYTKFIPQTIKIKYHYDVLTDQLFVCETLRKFLNYYFDWLYDVLQIYQETNKAALLR